jgi:outer membrane lipoprotein SlyB
MMRCLLVVGLAGALSCGCATFPQPTAEQVLHAWDVHQLRVQERQACELAWTNYRTCQNQRRASTNTGTFWGFMAGVALAAATGGLSIVPSMIGGAVVGGVGGAVVADSCPVPSPCD